MNEYSSEHDSGDVERAKELANFHWCYIEELLKLHGEHEDVIERIGFHYRSSMIHGYLHRCREEREGGR